MSNRKFSGELAFAASQYTREMVYWLNRLSGHLVKSYFPYANARPGKSSTGTDENSDGNIPPGLVKFRVSQGIFEKLMVLRGDSDPKLHMILVAGIFALLFRYTGNKDIIIGTTIYNPGSRGNFINTLLPLRNQIKEHMSFKELLLQTRQVIIDAVEHANYPMEKIVHQLNMPVFQDEFPLFDLAVLLKNLQNKQHIHHISLNMLFSFLRGDGYVEAEVEYNPRKYNQAALEQVFKHYACLLDNALQDLDTSLIRIDILPEEEKNKLLYQVNSTMTPYPQDKTLHRLFAEQAERTHDHVALVGQDSGQEGTRGLAPLFDHVLISYRKLNDKSNQLAHYLREKGVLPYTIVAIMAERSIAMIVAILSILKAGGAYLAIDPDYPEERINYMLADSSVEVLLTTAKLQAKVKAEVEEKFIEIVDISNLSSYSTLTSASTCQASPTNLAYIIYTSGSTGFPKGVAVQHQSVVNYIKWAENVYLQGKKYDFPLYSSLAVDLTVTSIYLPLISGNKLFIYKGGEHEDVISEIIRENRVQVIKLTPTHLKILRNLEIHQSDIRTFIVGGEELPTPLAAEIYKKFHRQVDIYNEYGPTETVVGCMIYKYHHERDKRGAVPIGTPINNTAIYVVDPHLNPVPPGVIGEIHISGEGVARGYLNNPELTAEKFVLAHSSWLIAHRETMKLAVKFPMSYQLSAINYIYKTGDLARWLPEGNIEFLGRIDHQVKISGYRIEPAEIENKLLAYKKIKEAVVVPRGRTAEKKQTDTYLCAYFVADGVLNLRDLKEHLSNHLPGYMIPLHFMQLDRLPLTASGKLDRNNLPAPVIRPLEKYCPPADAIEEQLVDIWADILEVEKAIIGIDTNFFQLGGHSLTATVLVSRIHKELKSKLTLVDIFNRPTIRKLAGYIKKTRGGEENYISIEPVPLKEYYPLSSHQKRLYVLHQVEEKSILYNMPQTLQPGADIDIDLEKVANTFKRLIQRHESLRTSFVMIDDRPVQRIHAEVEFKIEYDRSLVNGHWSLVNCQGRGEVPSPIKVDKMIKNFIRPFDLTKAPLLRVGLINLHTPPFGHPSQEGREQSFIFMFDMHHIISDGISMNTFAKEFITLYQGENLPRLRLQYKDYAVWQNSDEQKIAIKRQEEYWLNIFSGEIPVLHLPLDFTRPQVQSFAGSRVYFELGSEETGRIKRLAGSEDVSLYMLLLAVFNVLVSKLSGQEDIIMGSPAAGRRHADLRNTIGMFVNTLTLRNWPNKEKTFTEFLESVKINTLAALENQDYPFEELVEKVWTARDTSRNPLFDVMLVMQNLQQPESTTDLLAAEALPKQSDRYQHESSISKFDLTLTAREAGNTLHFSIEYCTKLFKSQTIEGFLRYMKNLFPLVCRSPGQRIAELEILTSREKKQLLGNFNCTRSNYPKDKRIEQLFERQAAATPHHIAVGFHRQFITYEALNIRAHTLAASLYDRGVRPDSIAAIMQEPSLEMIVGVLAILKAGGAYL
ncbi:MAG: amino acid adenylation domain-containing protein, partial [Candidatus Aminicenantes bacterium]